MSLLSFAFTTELKQRLVLPFCARSMTDKLLREGTGIPGVGALDEYQQGALKALWKSEASSLNTKPKSEEHGHGHGHGHGEKPPSIVAATISAVINFLLMFGLCCAYGMIMFTDPWNAEHRGLGVKMNLGTALVVGLLCAKFSKVGVCIGGPDLNPVVFLGMFVATIAEELEKKHDLKGKARKLQELCDSAADYGSDALGGFDSWLSWFGDEGGRRLAGACSVGASAASAASATSGSAVVLGNATSATSGSSARLLAAASPSEGWCMGYLEGVEAEACALYHEELRATVLFAVAFSSFLFAILFILLGRLKLVKLVTLIPASIMEAFLSCIGYKVFKYALKFCGYQARTFIPAVCIGVPLYFMKALHVGNPAIVIPAMLLIPLAIYYVIIFLVYQDDPNGFIYGARSSGLFFDVIEDVPFWKIWEDSIFKAYRIDFNAWVATLPDMIIMVIVVLLDCLLKISSTESKLPVKVDKEWEIQVYGASNFATALCGSSVGYMQLKFNVINYGVVGNITDRRAGVIYALLCGVCFFWTVELFNFMPRFFIGVLLFFAGSGFVAENLWGSRKFLSIPEWIQVLGIVGTFIFTGQLTYAVVVGGLLCGAAFIYRYAKVPCLDGPPRRGGEVITCEHYDPYMQSTISHMANTWLMVFSLKGFIFFASAVSMTASITSLLEKQEAAKAPAFKRIRYVIFDCKSLDGLDASALKALLKLVGAAAKMNVKVLWCDVSKQLKADLIRTGTLPSEDQYFQDLSKAVLHVEARILERAKALQDKWCLVHPAFNEYLNHVRTRVAYEPFHDALSEDSARFGTPWAYCDRVKLEQYKTVLWTPGQIKCDVFLIHSGAVGIFTSLPSKEHALDSSGRFGKPLMVFRHGSLINIAKLVKKPTDYYAIALEDGEVLAWNSHSWRAMSSEQPLMLEGFMREAMSQMHSQSLLTTPAPRSVTDEADVEAEMKSMMSAAEHIPYSLQRIVVGLHMAQSLERIGFYEAVSPEGSTLADIPARLRKDLDIAFHTIKGEGSSTLDLPEVRKALMYAGIFGTSFYDAAQSFNHGEFLALAREAYSLRLSSSSVEKINSVYDEAAKAGSGPNGVHFDALFKAMKAKFGTYFSEETVMGTASALFKDERTMSLNKEEFQSLMARLTRRHELDWHLLKGFREVMGCDPFADEGQRNRLSVNLHAKESGSTFDTKHLKGEGSNISDEEAEEMIWAANCGGASELDFRLVYQVLHTVYRESGVLPPVPKAAPADAGSAAPALSESIRKLVVDLRDSSSATAVNRGEAAAAEVGFGDADRVRNTGENQEFKPDDAFVVATTIKESEIPDTTAAKMHQFFDYPESSPAANVYSLAMGILIMLSVLTMVAEPLVYESDPLENAPQYEQNIWMGIEATFTILFTLELLLRFLLAPALKNGQTYLSFWAVPMNLCDLVAVVPFYIDIIFGTESEGFRLLRVLRLTRLARMARLGKLASRSSLFAPTAVVMTIIWFIYLKSRLEC
eukprot:TRINITY_DN10765_c0_g2_i4.p1 TRINITY_DN10765_c0_g2~~TRINITY_DN10765_c0_g2_i4.p1  ORF type:complete len:1488 (+),score=352.65 TRINITY_DN10765_c0_g2_i4:76-4539(+)